MQIISRISPTSATQPRFDVVNYAGISLHPGVGTLSLAISDPPTQAQVSTILDQSNTLIGSRRRTS